MIIQDQTTPSEFTQLFRRLCETSHLSTTYLAKAAQLDVAYVHRLRSGERIHPSRDRVIQLAFALKLTLDQTNELLWAAGYAPLVKEIGRAHV